MAVESRADIHSILKSSFGYSSFRPLQQEIFETVLAGQDVFALMPTGGGKSMCYQLPAIAMPGTAMRHLSFDRLDERSGRRITSPGHCRDVHQ